ncbi:unnamed protein product [Cuscuta campestris]|uniref:Helicase ATP-binding domain-containing protein n=1 Tax=Cuscuta campestris TaxID=132261 RepID=A0A484KI12_9ASTE|nr:unnamed protein product [Cuscuta campestris]
MAEHSEEEEEKSFKELGVCDQLVEACHNLGWKTASKIQAELVGGIDKVRQSILLANRPNILVATPGRLLDHLSDTEGFSLRGLKFLVLDEADKLLNADFEKALDKLLGYISPRERTYLFSATMSKKSVLACHQTKIIKETKWTVLRHVLMRLRCTRTCDATRFLALMLRNLGLSAIPISGQMTQVSDIPFVSF